MDGIYILADDSMEDMAITCLNSLRALEPRLPICFIPFRSTCERMLSIAGCYGLSVWDDKAALELCDEISLLFHPELTGHYRKLVAWLGNFDRFIYLDIDTLFFRPLEPLFSLLSSYDILTAVSNMPGIRQFVWKDSFRGSGSALDTEYAANTGFLLSRRNLFSRESLRSLAMAAVPLKQHMTLDCVEQPLLNYIITASGVRYSSLSELRKQDKTIPAELWGGRWNGRLLDLQELPLCVHWAGVWRTDQHKATPVWQHFRHLPMPPQ